jgi:hypothetical protein
MARSRGALGTFDAPGAAAAAIRALRGAGFEVRAAMPAPFPEVLAALGRPRSAIDLAALPGVLAGAGLGALLTAGGALAWPIVTGAKPIVSVPPFAIVTFEVAILVGALATLAAFSGLARRGGRPEAFPSGADFTSEGIGVFAAGPSEAEAERILRAHGAGEVRRVA